MTDQRVTAALSRFLPALKRAASLMLVVILLSSCYLPLRFDAEIEIDRQGYYSFIFDGYLADVDFYNAIRKGEMTPAEQEERVELIRRDLERDSSTKEFAYLRKGIFKLNWQREGDLIRSRAVVFLRRNERIFDLSYNKDTRYIRLVGTAITGNQKTQLEQIGLNMEGELRVLTDARAKVLTHNADVVKEFTRAGNNMKAYIFRFPDIRRATPSMTISLK